MPSKTTSAHKQNARQSHRHPDPAPIAHYTPSWRAISSLFPPLPACFQMDALYKALQKVRPLSQKHRRSLASDILSLSRLLTCERGALRAPYWRSPAYISAYLYYFLPWNVIRLGRLLTSLPLPDPAALAAPLLLDAGSGPLTLPLALWLARPGWRRLPIHIAALDAARLPLQLGQALLRELAELTGEPAWQTTLFAGPLPALGRFSCGDRQPWLVSAANVLNEVKFRKHATAEDAGDDLEDSPFADLLAAWQPLFKDAKPSLLFVEPGTRLGSGAIMRLRAAAISLGLFAISPCTHQRACPLLAKPGAWCHFVFSAQDAPQWLKEISREARLFKSSLSLSPLLLAPRRPEHISPPGMPTRVVSQDFEARGVHCRYGCNACGLCLLPNSLRLCSGSLCLAARPGTEQQIDRKSGAIALSPYL